MKKSLLFLAFATLLFTWQNVNAQNARFNEGDRSVAIIVNPIFSYVGNLFDQDSYSSLYLSSAGMIFRKFKSETRANRFGFNLNLSNSTQGDLGSLETRNTSFADLGFDFGKEYRKSFTNLSVYGGWLGGLSFENRTVTYNYDYRSPIPSFRPLEYNYGSTASINFGGFLGAEYYFSEHFFMGVEVNLRGRIGYSFNESQTLEIFQSSGNGTISTTEKISLDDSFSYSVYSDNLVLFVAGLKF